MRKTQFFVLTILLAFLVSVQSAYAVPKNRTAVSPYVQTDANSTYSFVGITHPSLNTAVTQIGLTIATVGFSGTNPSSSFTIGAGETYRIFVVSTNHSTINSLTFTDSNVLFLGSTSGSSESGQLQMSASSTQVSNAVFSDANATNERFNNLNQISMWGAIVIPSSSTGFAMEFVGDAHDSVTMADSLASNTLNRGRGIN
jgi:hypothetical protein|tara:strand:- start:1245 stop:1844 length:600 start_codon:yes stop_codon:yes gene_type:complete